MFYCERDNYFIEAHSAFDFELARYRIAVAAVAAALLAGIHTRRSRRGFGGCSVGKPERDE